MATACVPLLVLLELSDLGAVGEGKLGEAGEYSRNCIGELEEMLGIFGPSDFARGEAVALVAVELLVAGLGVYRSKIWLIISSS